ncbi:hypothetical protein ACQ86N_40360 [Puia sp. P3]|uniref:hypothetical protein n=1 Tax=Puia sp. P3 TaxID=3423952 RepID=UPI003D66DFB0
MRSQVKEGATPEWQRKTALLAILFANGAMYTHERYMMIFPFIILAILLFPGFRALTGRQKGELIVLAIASLAVNYFVKTRVYSLPYFLGTANAKMTFSVGDAIHFYFDAILSVIQINSGPEFLVGIRFPGLPAYQKILVVAMIGGLVYLLAAFIRKVRKRLFSNNRDRDSAVLVVSLVILLHLLLIPAVSTIRLEQRWIQGPFAVFVLILTILFRELPYKSGRREALFFGGLVLVYVVTDFTYLSRGAGNFAMIYSERTATSVKDAIDNGVIHADTHELYIWEKQRSENYEAGIDWELASGSFFEFYQNSPKKIYFVDSIYDSAYPGGFSSFGNFDKTSKQIVYLDKNVIDITGDYLRDSLKIFTTRTIGNIGAFTSAQYNARQITYRADDLDRYALRGIYENERGLRWTSGDASVQLLPAPTVKDSLLVELTAYMPEICKNIIPKVTIVTDSNNALQPISSGRKADKFIYRFNVERPAEIRAINILSDTLSGQFVKDRPLSFPLSSLDLIFLR